MVRAESAVLCVCVCVCVCVYLRDDVPVVSSDADGVEHFQRSFLKLFKAIDMYVYTYVRIYISAGRVIIKLLQVHAKETYIQAKEVYIQGKEAYI